MNGRIRDASINAHVRHAKQATRQRMFTAYVALGSNLGDREGNLERAVEGMREHPQIVVARESPVYESAALTADPAERQPHYLNAVVELKTSLTPRELLECLHRIEQTAGRRRRPGERWKSRTLDLDILVYGSKVVDAPGLTIPHPRMGERRFVLQPLSDLRPELRIPAPFEATVSELLEGVADELDPVQVAPSVSRR